MSDGPQPMNPHFKKIHDARQEGIFNAPGSADVPRDAVGQAAYEQGKRLREMGKAPAGGSDQTLGEAIHVAFGLAGGAAGLLYGASRVGAGQASWGTAFGLAALGLVGGLAFWGGIVWAARRAGSAVMWRRGRDERDAEMLGSMWEARFGRPIADELLREIDDDGRGWAMDRRGNFHLRMRSGKVFFVGMKGGGLRTEASGRGGTPLDDAYPFVLVHKSLGDERIRVTEGSKNRRRALWVAASLAGLEVDDYTPDGKAVRMLADARRDRGEVAKNGDE